ncbi:MAG TPA: NADH-quinone oxidoreductase subunit C [Bdellovibrionota bacterium]|jgi:NADH:ubiquinone oxidoreductase subunit C|nr:NADH-quinone oxidoreductase subunit C [Bdellovibrionota bacterium]
MSAWLETFRTKFKDVILRDRESAPGEAELMVKPEAILDVLTFLKSADGGDFNHLADLTSYDETASTPRFHVVYELVSMSGKQRCAVIAQLPDDNNPHIASVVPLWSGANWLEREVYDLMGVHFDDHPDHRRILLPPSFKGHPLQKDFLVDYRQSYKGSESDQNLFDPFSTSIIKGNRD